MNLAAIVADPVGKVSPTTDRSADFQSAVSQIFNLPELGLYIACGESGRLQNIILRDSRLKICAASPDRSESRLVRLGTQLSTWSKQFPAIGTLCFSCAARVNRKSQIPD